MMALELTLRTWSKHGGGIHPGETSPQWILNADPVPVGGIVYQWMDASLWIDANVWKD